MTYMSRNPQVASVVLDDITTTTPSNPPSGKVKVVDRNGTLFVRNSSGAESAIGTTSSVGSGEKNYIENPSAAASISGWTNVGDLDVVRTATAADLPRENTTKTGIKITADSNTQSAADYVYYDFTLDDVDASGRIMKIKWDQKVTGTYTAGQLEVVITTQADRTTAIATPFTTAIPASDGTFQTYFLAPSTATCSLVIRATADMTTDGGIVISDVVVGPNVQVQGSAIGAWKSYTPTFGVTGGSTTATGFYREVGGDIECYVQGVFATVFTGGTMTVTIPSGFTIDTTKLPSNNTSTQVGTCILQDVGVNGYPGSVEYNGSNTVRLYSLDDAQGTSTSYVGLGQLDTTKPFTWANNDYVTASFKVPVNELSANVTLANRAVEVYAADDGSSDVFGPNGALVPNQVLGSSVNRAFTLPSTVQQTDFSLLEYKLPSGNWQVAADLFPFVRQGAKLYGVRGYWSSATEYTVVFGDGGRTSDNTTFAANGTASWADGYAAGDRFRLRKVSGGASVGYPISSANIVGRTDGVAPSAGVVGWKNEVSQVSGSFGGSSGIIGGVATLAIPSAGEWDVFFTLTGIGGTYTSLVSILSDVSTSSAVFGGVTDKYAFPAGNSTVQASASCMVRYTATSAQTLYLNLFSSFSVVPSLRYTFSIRRVA